MFCKNCGTQSKEDHKYCAVCGKSFSPIEKKLETPSTQRKGKINKIWRIIRISSGIAVVGILILLKLGSYALNSREEAIISKINSAQTAYELGGDPDVAIKQLNEAYEATTLNSTKLSTKKNLAYIYSTESENDLTLKSFKDALEFAPSESLDFYLISGEIALLESNSDIALIQYNKAYAITPNDVQINNSLNLFYLDLESKHPRHKNYPKALTYALKAHEVQQSELTKQNLAIAYFFNEDYKQTISLLLSTNLNSDPYLSYWLGNAYIGDNQPEAAKYHLKIAQDKGVPIDPELSEYMKNN